MGYTKLFSDIVMSTIWDEPDHIRILWITMLSLRDEFHKVNGSIPGLAKAARITLAQCEEGLKKLSSPDPYSRTKDHEGRRIEAADGGWFILNGEKYRNKMNEDERREYWRIKQQEYRSVNKSKQISKTVNDSQGQSTMSTQSEKESEKEIKNKSSHERSVSRIKLVTTDYSWDGITDQDRKQWQQSFPAVNLDIELAKAAGYIKANPNKIKKNWSRYLFNWLNRVQERGGNSQQVLKENFVPKKFEMPGGTEWKP